MVLGRFLLDSFVVCYAGSLLMYFVDAVEPRRVVNRTALFLLFVSFCLETAFLLRQLRQDGLTAMYTRFDVTLLTAWLILLVALAVNSFFRIDIAVFLANLLGFLIVLGSSFSYSGHAVYTAAQGDLLVFHIALAIASYVAFAFSFIFSVMYLLQERWLRVKRWNGWFFRIPSLARLDVYATGALVVGFPALLISIALGAVWGKATAQVRPFIDDPKVWVTGIVCVAYGALLFLRFRTGWGTVRFVWLNVACFIVLVLNFALVGHFSANHRATL